MDEVRSPSSFNPGMDFDEWRRAWHQLARERGHDLVVDDDGDVNEFVTSGGTHNGPGCTKCGWSACMHCDWKGEKIPACASPSEHPATRADLPAHGSSS